MTHDQAIAKIRAGLTRLAFGARRAAAFKAFDCIVGDAHAGDAVLRQSRDDLIDALPELAASVETILANRIAFTRRRGAKPVRQREVQPPIRDG